MYKASKNTQKVNPNLPIAFFRLQLCYSFILAKTEFREINCEKACKSSTQIHYACQVNLEQNQRSISLRCEIVILLTEYDELLLNSAVENPEIFDGTQRSIFIPNDQSEDEALFSDDKKDLRQIRYLVSESGIDDVFCIRPRKCYS